MQILFLCSPSSLSLHSQISQNVISVNCTLKIGLVQSLLSTVGLGRGGRVPGGGGGGSLGRLLCMLCSWESGKLGLRESVTIATI